MKILVIGGSYFYGRVFVMLAAKEHEVTVVNRGTYSIEELGAKQIIGNRKDASIWEKCTEDFDVIVDFCGYDKGDIHTVLANLKGSVKHYIFISTVDVYRHGGFQFKEEDSALENAVIPGEVGDYIKGKIALEEELAFECGKREIHYTILRPAILYGPYNYAPRESVYIKMLVQNHILLNIADAEGKFQFVYIKDAAQAILNCLLNQAAFEQTYNICNDTVIDYPLFFEALQNAADVPFELTALTVDQAQAQNIPLLFPLIEAEVVLCSNEKSKKELGMQYTSLSEGMIKTYHAFKNVFEVS